MLGAVALGLTFALGSIVFFPRPVLSILAGLCYGLTGIAVALIGATLGAALAFWLSRRFAQVFLCRVAKRRPLLRALTQAIEEEGWRAVLLLRLGPIFPSSLQSYFLGTTRIALLPYLLATAAGIFPGIALQVSVGAAAKSALLVHAQPWHAWLIGAGLASCALAVVLIGQRVRRPLSAKALI